MTEFNSRSFISAIRDFQRARFKADMEQMIARLRGQSAELLSFEEVRQQLKGYTTFRRELKEIPLDAIVGSVDRYDDFTRSFLPRQDSNQSRWARIGVKMTGLEGLPPIEVYQIGEAYFVIDGNHRVSVAREMGASHIEAYVTPVHTKVPLPADAKPDDVILKARYLEFMERTGLDKLRPEADLTVSVPGQYRILDKHIELHRYFMSLEQDRELSYEEAVVNWYDEVYLLVVEAIREQGLLAEFPGRTETDLYLWVSGYRAFLEEELGWGVDPGSTDAEKAFHPGPRFQNLVSRLATRVVDKIAAGESQTNLLPGQWRREHLLTLLQSQTGRPFRLFTSILVPVNGEEVGWYALYQAIGIARREGGRLLGLHVVPTEAERKSEAVQALKAEFNRRCVKAGIPGQLAVEAGAVAAKICDRAKWVDLIVVRLAYPPAPQAVAKLSSGFHTLIRRCHSPILVVPRNFVYPLDQALLAYDGSPKAKEALYIAAYLAGRWTIPLVVITVTEKDGPARPLEEARAYLQTRGVEATFISDKGPVAETVVNAAETHDSNLIIMGGYGYNPVLEVVLGSAVDEVLRTSRRPVLICR